MKKFIKIFVLLLVFIVSLTVPQKFDAYEFSSASREQNVKRTRSEIFDLYNVYKEIIKTEDASSNQYGVIGYNGVCSSVSVNGMTMTLDEYVAGVIKSEAAPGNMESLKAQAIAARSFLLYNKRKASSCVVGNTTDSFQVFKSKADPNSDFTKAAKETSGMVVSRNGEIALTQYQSYPAKRYQKEDATGWHVKFQRFNDDPSTEWTWDGPPKSDVLSVTYGYEMDSNNPHHFGMSQTISAYLALKENYTYQQIIELFYGEPIVTLTDGVSDGNITYVQGGIGNVIYWNQGDYAAYDYGYGCGSIKACGCGPTSVAIVASTILNKPITPVETTKAVCNLGGCTSGGSYNSTLGKTLSQVYGIKVETTTDDQKVINALATNKAIVIAHMGFGTFTSGKGHYIVLTGVNDKKQVSVADPGSRNRTEKKWFDFSIIISEKKGQYTIAYKS